MDRQGNPIEEEEEELYKPGGVEGTVRTRPTESIKQGSCGLTWTEAEGTDPVWV